MEQSKLTKTKMMSEEKSEWNQDDRRDLSDMTEEEINEFHKKLIEVFSKAYKIPKKFLNPNQNKEDE